VDDPNRGSTGAVVGAVVGKFRWVICALLFFGVTKNYMDRQVLGLLKPTIQGQLGWNEIDYGNLVFTFQLAYACGMVVMGRVIDRFGTRLGYAFAMVFWSLASMAHAAAGSFSQFVMARAALGLGESGVFPASIKTVAEWFPKKERSFATGIFNAGTNVGAILTPPLIAFIVLYFNWRWAFIITGGIGFVWLAFWLTVYRTPEEHPSLGRAELEYIQSDPQERVEKIPWLRLLPHRQTWAFVMAKGLTDPVWWFYLFWVPDFLQKTHGLKLAGAVLPNMVIYTIADVGSVGGGWLPGLMIKRGMTANAARKLSMLFCALCVLPVAFVPSVSGLWTAVLLIGLAAAAHQGFSANAFTLTSDMFPSRAVGSVTGIGGMAGAVGGMFTAKVIGYVLQTTGSYRIPFLMAGSAYLVALAFVQILAPRLEPAHLDT
jgi:ACS family hexuronate transporter-like MFS transporter